MRRHSGRWQRAIAGELILRGSGARLDPHKLSANFDSAWVRVGGSRRGGNEKLDARTGTGANWADSAVTWYRFHLHELLAPDRNWP